MGQTTLVNNGDFEGGYQNSPNISFSVGSSAMWKHQTFGIIPVQIKKLNGKIATVSYPIDEPRHLRQTENVLVKSLQVMLKNN